MIEFNSVLSELCPGYTFDESVVHDLYHELPKLIGQWCSERERLEVAPVAKALWSIGRELDSVAEALSGHETGLHSSLEIEIVSQLAKYLALDPTVGSLSNAYALMAPFQQNAAKIARACLIAAADLGIESGRPGRPRLDWYDDFTALLLRIAELAEIAPKLSKDRITEARSGWLFEAAQALEAALWPGMRSLSPEACGKRLERSMRRLRSRKGQKPPESRT